MEEWWEGLMVLEGKRKKIVVTGMTLVKTPLSVPSRWENESYR